MATLEGKRIFNDPNCKECGGIGVVATEYTDSFKHCKCHYIARAAHYVATSGIPSAFLSCRAKNYVAKTPEERESLARLKKWLPELAPGSPGLFLHGKVGTGKTHLLCAIAHAAIEKSAIRAYYRTAHGLLASIRGEMNEERQEQSQLDLASTCKLLCLDDLGMDRATDWSIETLTSVIDARYSNQLTTVIASNLDFEGLKTIYGPRLTDRIAGMCVKLLFNGSSRRVIKESAQ